MPHFQPWLLDGVWNGAEEMVPQQLIIVLVDHTEGLNSSGRTHVQWDRSARDFSSRGFGIFWPSMAHTLYTHTLTHNWHHLEHGNGNHVFNYLLNLCSRIRHQAWIP